MTDRVQRALDVIDEQVIDGGFAPGGQVSCWAQGQEVVSGSVGTDARGVPLGDDSLFATYCMAKPILALTIGRLADLGEMSFDDRLGDVLPCTGTVGGFTIADVLSHEVRLDVPEAIDAMLIDQATYRASLLAAPAWRLEEPRYSEFAAWRLLALAVEETVGVPLHEYVAEEILASAGAIDDLWLGPWSRGDAERLRVNGSVALPGHFTPLLAERGNWLSWTVNPGYGGYLSTAAMVKTLGAVLGSQTGESLLDPGTALALADAGPLHHDEVMQRRCRFGRGVLVDMRCFGLDRCASPVSFGQVGLMGMSAAVADPAGGIVAAYHLTAYTDADTMNDWLRPVIMERLLS